MVNNGGVVAAAGYASDNFAIVNDATASEYANKIPTAENGNAETSTTAMTALIRWTKERSDAQSCVQRKGPQQELGPVWSTTMVTAATTAATRIAVTVARYWWRLSTTATATTIETSITTTAAAAAATAATLTAVAATASWQRRRAIAFRNLWWWMLNVTRTTNHRRNCNIHRQLIGTVQTHSNQDKVSSSGSAGSNSNKENDHRVGDL